MNFPIFARLFGAFCLVLTVAGCGSKTADQTPTGTNSAATVPAAQQQAGQEAAQRAAQQAAAMQAAKQARPNGQ